MRPIQGPLNSALGPGVWLPVDWIRESFGIALQGLVSPGASLTWKVQYTVDELAKKQITSITQAATVATGILANHMLAVGDSVVVEGAGAPLDGQYDVASVADANTFTYTVANSGATAAPGARVTVLRVYDHAVMTGKTAKFDGSIITPVTAVRINNTIWASGSSQLTVLQGQSI